MTNRPSIWFRAVGLAATLFILTVFFMIAGLFSDPKLPLNVWFNRHGILLLLGEVGVMIALGTLAMVTDRASIVEPDLALTPRLRFGEENHEEVTGAPDDSPSPDFLDRDQST